MLKKLFSLFFLQNIYCFFSEIEAITGSKDLDMSLGKTMTLKKFYWFKLENKYYLMHFNRALKDHENPFLLLILIPYVQNDDWFSPTDCQLLTLSFENFYENSAYISLLPNEQNRTYYKVVALINEARIEAVVHLGETITFVGKQFALQSFTDCPLLLKSIKAGTISWECFYKEEGKDSFYGLYIESYYIIYRNSSKSTKTVPFLRIGGLTDISFILFETKSVQGNLFLTGNDDFLQLDAKKTLFCIRQNIYTFEMFWSDEFFIQFPSQEGSNKQMTFHAKDTRLFEVDIPVIKRLTQIDQKVYLIKNIVSEEIKVEIPVFLFGQKVELSKLVIAFRIIVQKPNGLLQHQLFVNVYNFTNKENCFRVSSEEDYFISFGYSIENEKLIFIITNAKDSNDNSLEVSSVKDIETAGEGMKRKTSFLSGAIIWDPDTKVTLTGSKYKAEKQDIKQISDNGLKYFVKKHKNKIIFLLVTLVLLVICFFVKRGFTYHKKKIKQKRKLNRKMLTK